MSTIGNLIWFIFGGFFMGLSWWLVGIVALISIIGIPWAKACFVMGKFAFFPFGQEAIERNILTEQEDIGTGPLGTLGNVVWFIVFGLWLALSHLVLAIFYALTLIGIPFAIQHLKLAGIAIAPIGKTVVAKEVAAAARNSHAAQTVAMLRK